MFVKWTARKKTRASHLGPLIICKLVESYRDDDGKPKHRTIKYLGSVREAMPINHRIVFWLEVNASLAAVDTRDDEVARIREGIERRVPYATPIEWWGGKMPDYFLRQPVRPASAA